MKYRSLGAFLGLGFILVAAGATSAALPEGDDACTEACATLKNEAGEVIGHACIVGTARKNCVATVASCGGTTEGCTVLPGGEEEGFASLPTGSRAREVMGLDGRAWTAVLSCQPEQVALFPSDVVTLDISTPNIEVATAR